MIPTDALVLLDTNVLVELVRGKKAGQKIDERYQLRARREKPLISIVTHGEMDALARNFGWGTQRVDAMKSLLRELVTVDIANATVVARYGEVTHFCKSNGHALGDNDRWIAATTWASGASLLTTDRDFAPLYGSHVQGEWIDPATLK